MMSSTKKPLEKRRKGWLLNSLITAAVVVVMVGLVRVDATIAWGIAFVGFASLIVFFYLAGRPTE